MAAMQKIIKAQLMSNGLILVVDKTDGTEEQFLVSDDGSAAYRSLRGAAEASAGASSKSYTEPEEEPRRTTTIDEEGAGVEDEDDDYTDDDSLLGDAQVLFQGAADFVNRNPGVGQFLGSMISGMNSAEAKRHRVREGKAKKK